MGRKTVAEKSAPDAQADTKPTEQHDADAQNESSKPLHPSPIPSGPYKCPGTQGWSQNQLKKAKPKSDPVEPLAEPTIERHEAKQVSKFDQQPASIASKSWREKQGGPRRPPATYAQPRKPSFVWPKDPAVAPAVAPAQPPPSNTTDPVPALPLFISSSSANYKTDSSTGKTWEDFDVGDVFWVEWTIHNTDPKITADSQYLFQTRDGPKVTKVRLHVCISKSEFIMKTLPIYSHGDVGIAKIPSDRQYEYMCVKQAGDKTLVGHPLGCPTLTFESTLANFNLRPTSTIRLVESRPVKYDQPTLKVGYIIPQVIELLKQQIGRAEQDGNRKFSQKTDKQKRDEKVTKGQASIAAVKTMPMQLKKMI
ncbi:hypothetical protein CBER1_10453 [Cercospora berteroae]|uniref:Uncharacterized protein n=1 Tax=Cercospora berteroae TaxID=357750 RepID=A0A2S6CGE4_9PEZI|nr:hypothetical protein CBER1_10453 [Cercospora berteroae]